MRVSDVLWLEQSPQIGKLSLHVQFSSVLLFSHAARGSLNRKELQSARNNVLLA